MSDNDIDQDRYNALADWAESDDRELHPEQGASGPQSRDAARDLLRRAGGRPSLTKAAAAGEHSPRRQVRLPKPLSDRLDALAATENRSASDLMREAITEYVASRDYYPA